MRAILAAQQLQGGRNRAVKHLLPCMQALRRCAIFRAQSTPSTTSSGRCAPLGPKKSTSPRVAWSGGRRTTRRMTSAGLCEKVNDVPVLADHPHIDPARKQRASDLLGEGSVPRKIRQSDHVDHFGPAGTQSLGAEHRLNEGDRGLSTWMGRLPFILTVRVRVRAPQLSLHLYTDDAVFLVCDDVDSAFPCRRVSDRCDPPSLSDQVGDDQRLNIRFSEPVADRESVWCV
jgi:hypothetical protein